MAVTIATHNGTIISIAHNLRKREFIERENENWAKRHDGEIRIDLSREHEIWLHEDIKEKYHELFDESVKKWNDKQEAERHQDRMITNYYTYLKKKELQQKNALHPVYEMIYSIGNVNNHLPDDITKKILKEITDTFAERNPHLIPVGIYYHADEYGVIHCHLDYIPYATGCTRGLECQPNLSRALKQQGIENEGYSKTSLIKFEKQENQTLEALCNRYGYEVEHPLEGKKLTNLSIEEYRLKKQIEEKQAELEKLNQLPVGKIVVNKARLTELESIEKTYQIEKPMIEQAKRDIRASEETLRAYYELERRREHLDEEINQLANVKVEILKDKAIEFIKALGVWEQFRHWTERLSKTIQESQSIKEE